MKFQSTVTYLFLVCSIISSYGCAGLQGLSAGQAWSDNYALMEGTQANDPAIIDGDLKTIGKSQYVESSSGTIRGMMAPSDSIVLLPETKSLHRLVVHSSNLQAFDIWVSDPQGRWEKIKEIKSNKSKVIDVRLNRTVRTTGVKLRIRRTSDDAEQRHKNLRREGGGFRTWSGNIRAVAKIAEVELYGFVSKDSAEDVPNAPAQNAPSKEEEDEKELDELLEF